MIALILCIECNKTYITEDSRKNYKFYEYEAINCVYNWRLNGGWLKDIPIYCLCCTKNIPSQKTIDKLKELNVTYIEDYNPDIDNSNYLFLNAVYTQYYFSKLLKDYKLIYIDLDIYLQNPLPKQLIESNLISIAYYDKQPIAPVEFVYRYNNLSVCFNTYFIIFNANDNFIEIHYKLINDLNYISFFNKYIFYKENVDTYFFEEGLFDYVYLNQLYPVNQYNLLKSSELEQKYFIHKHLTAKDVTSIRWKKNLL